MDHTCFFVIETQSNSVSSLFISIHTYFVFSVPRFPFFKSMASKNFSFILSSAMNMTDGSEDDDSLFGEDGLSDNDSLDLNDDKSHEHETPNR